MIDAHIPSAFLVGIRMEFFLPVRKSDLLILKKNQENSGPALGTENEPRFGVDERAADSSRKRLHGGIATRAAHLGDGLFACLHADQDRAP